MTHRLPSLAADCTRLARLFECSRMRTARRTCVPLGRRQAIRRAGIFRPADYQVSPALAVQLDPALRNARNGFLLVYLNSYNEWHEGHSFERMKDWAELTADERALGYRNPERGDYRLRELARLQRKLLKPVLTVRTREHR